MRNIVYRNIFVGVLMGIFVISCLVLVFSITSVNGTKRIKPLKSFGLSQNIQSSVNGFNITPSENTYNSKISDVVNSRQLKGNSNTLLSSNTSGSSSYRVHTSESEVNSSVGTMASSGSNFYQNSASANRTMSNNGSSANENTGGIGNQNNVSRIKGDQLLAMNSSFTQSDLLASPADGVMQKVLPGTGGDVTAAEALPVNGSVFILIFYLLLFWFIRQQVKSKRSSI